MAPRITLHSSASGISTPPRVWSTLDQHPEEDALPNGMDASLEIEMEVDEEPDELSDMDDSEPEPDEVDELDESDSGEKEAQPQWATISSASASAASAAPGPATAAGASSAKAAVKRQRPKPPTTRSPGQTIVPISRVEAIMSADIGQGGASKEASFLISLATEEFIRRLTRAANCRSRLDKRSLTTYNDIADTAYYFEEYKFLEEMISRPMPLKAALAERERILKEQEALLHGVGVHGADSGYANKCNFGQTSASASTSKASTPIPRLTKPKPMPSTSANGKTSSSRSKNANAATQTSPPVVRSERQRSKKARLAAEFQAAAEAATAAATGSMAPPPSPAVNRHGSEESVVLNGSTNGGKIGSMKIKIRPRVASVASSAVPVNATSQLPILTLGPQPSKSLTSERETLTLHRSRPLSQPRNGEHVDKTSLVFEEDAKSGVLNGSPNGKTGNVQFAPVGVDASDQPLWTRVPLPPPPSAKVAKTPIPPEDSKNESIGMTDLDSAAEQARMVKASKIRHGSVVREPEHPSLPQEEPMPEPVESGLPSAEEPPAKRPRQRQRQRSGESTTSSKGSLREVLNGAFPNTGRTIYSQR